MVTNDIASMMASSFVEVRQPRRTLKSLVDFHLRLHPIIERIATLEMPVFRDVVGGLFNHVFALLLGNRGREVRRSAEP